MKIEGNAFQIVKDIKNTGNKRTLRDKINELKQSKTDILKQTEQDTSE